MIRRVAVINEGSTKHRNADVIAALDGFGATVLNLGMQNKEGEPDLSYMETALMSAICLNTKLVDFVFGGCGTGQGYMNAVLQYPGVFCGLLTDPIEAYLFTKVNAGNCASFQLNKGYGALGGAMNLRNIMKVLAEEPFGGGYPPERGVIQMGMRDRLIETSRRTHLPMEEILKNAEPETLRRTVTFPGFVDAVQTAPPSELRDLVVELAKLYS